MLRIKSMSKSDTTDSRGLPYSMDPRMFYEYSALTNKTVAVGLEGLLYRLIPYRYLVSFAFAIDPLANIKTSTGRVAARSRVRYRSLDSVLHESSNTYGTRITTSCSSIVDVTVGLGHHTPYLVCITPTHNDTPRTKRAQSRIMNVSKDSTYRTRPMGVDIGEFECYKSQILSSPRSYFGYRETKSTKQIDAPPWPPQRSVTRVAFSRYVDPMAATLSPSTSDLLRMNAESTAKDLIDDNILWMLKKANPSRQDYTLFRNMVELKDIPRSIVSLQKTALNLFALGKSLNIDKVSKQVHNLKRSLKDIPNEYLSYSFGWRQLYSDVMGLLSTPDKVSKRINYLIRRNGLDSTHRVKKDFILPNYVLGSGFNYSSGRFDEEQNMKVQHRVERKAQLRLAVNSRFSFPPADLPNFKERKFLDLMGISPTLMDLYNLTPWTWLFDWFTGFGNYLDIIIAMNSDPNLVNWGLITCVIDGELLTDMQSEVISTSSVIVNSSPAVNQSFRRVHTHQSIYSYKYILRKDVSSAQPSVRKFWDTSSLTSYQQSILGALIAQRLKFQR